MFTPDLEEVEKVDSSTRMSSGFRTATSPSLFQDNKKMCMHVYLILDSKLRLSKTGMCGRMCAHKGSPLGPQDAPEEIKSNACDSFTFLPDG